MKPVVFAMLMTAMAAPLLAQESKSAPLAKQLADALTAAKMTSIAAKSAEQADVYIAAMYLPGTLLVISAKFSVPAALDAKLARKDYQGAYADLQGVAPDAKVFVQDLNADGLRNKTFDSVDTAQGSTSFDGDWKKAKAPSEQEYQKMFADLDARYAQMLGTLIAAVR